jgi:hypothetical protein
MRRFGIGLAIGFITFLFGMVPFYYPFEGFFKVQGGLSDCVVRLDGPAKYGMPSGGELTDDYIDESRAVYAAVLEDEMYGRAYVVVGDTTTPTDWFAGLDLNRQLAGVEKETFDGYSGSNSISRYLHGLIDDPRVHFIDFDDSFEIFKTQRNGWAEFRRRFPSANGFITFSSVGLNSAHTQALVSVERQCGGLCGDGTFVVLKKVNGRWMIMRKIIAWES